LKLFKILFGGEEAAAKEDWDSEDSPRRLNHGNVRE
jgi:hypothetical protein